MHCYVICPLGARANAAFKKRTANANRLSLKTLQEGTLIAWHTPKSLPEFVLLEASDM